MSDYYLNMLEQEVAALNDTRGILNDTDNERTERRIEEIMKDLIEYEAQL